MCIDLVNISIVEIGQNVLKIGVHADLTRARRCDTGFHDGEFSFPAGHLEPDETLIQAMVRKTKEEIGLRLSEVFGTGSYHAQERTKREREGQFLL